MGAWRTRFGIMAAGLCCMLAVYSVAQQIETREDASDRAESSQFDRAQTQQADRSATQDVDRFESGQATSRLSQRDAQVRAGSQDAAVQLFLANCLLAKNEAEIEISEFAQQRAQNPQVKQFAQQLVQEHRQLVQQLQPLAQAQRGAATRTNAAQSPGASGQFDAQRQTSDTTRPPGSSGAAQSGARTATNAVIQAGGSEESSAAIQQLVQIDRRITERHKEAVREELQQKQAAEFDKCYLGAQVAVHMHMLAALETIEQQQQGQLAQVARQARPKVQQHLDHAKQLLEQLEQGSQRDGAQAERQQPRTQR